MARLSKSDTAVFVGSSCSDYADILQRDPERTEVFESTGTAQTMLANRISYFYDLKGPSVSVDTGMCTSLIHCKILTPELACSSSLVALHLACNALRLGESRTAIVGGSNLILSNTPLLALSMLRYFLIINPTNYVAKYTGFSLQMGAATHMTKGQTGSVGAKERRVLSSKPLQLRSRMAILSEPLFVTLVPVKMAGLAVSRFPAEMLKLSLLSVLTKQLIWTPYTRVISRPTALALLLATLLRQLLYQLCSDVEDHWITH